MEHRTTRGIQYEDVAHAADALLQDGLRPTIERIRLHIGRGSPNTVSPMLERWFAGLGQRLGGAGGGGAAPDGLPEVVRQAATKMWSTAREAALADAADAFAAQRASLDGEARQLAAATVELEARESVLQERLRTMDEALQLSIAQLRESNDRYKASLRTLAQRDEEFATQRTVASRLSEQNAALQLRWEAAQTQAQQERTVQYERHRLSERRWLEEVDRARQEARKSTVQVQDSLRKLGALRLEMDNAQSARHTADHAQAQEIQALRQELAGAQLQIAHAAQERALWTQLVQRHNAALDGANTLAKPRPTSVRLPPTRRKLAKHHR